MYIYLYSITAVVSLVLLSVLVRMGRKQNVTFYVLLSVCIALSNLGNLAVAVSKNVEEAVLANKIVYMGCVFMPFFMLMAVLQLCKLSVPRVVVPFLMIYQFVVFFFTLSIGYFPYYYASVDIAADRGVTYLVKTYGPAHSLYIILLGGYMLVTIGVILYSMFRKRKLSYKYAVLLLVAEFITIGSYVLERMLHSVMEWNVFVFLLDEIVLLFALRRVRMYDISETVARNLEEMGEYAYVVFDSKRKYMGCNARALSIVPELSQLQIDDRIEEKDAFLYKEFDQWIGDYENGKGERSHYIKRNGLTYCCKIRHIYHGRHKTAVGYCIEIVDDTRQQSYIKLLNNYREKLEAEVKEQTAHIYEMQNQLILGMADMVEGRDNSTGGHIKRTSEVIRIFTEELRNRKDEFGFDDDFLQCVVKMAPMHDLGKITIDDRILRKPGKYEPEEFAIMQTHSAKGAEIVEKVLTGVESEEWTKTACNIAHYHHEKWNGKGYPDGLAGEEIPVEARIMALADVLDALVSKRCYKEKMSYDEAFDIIEKDLGEHFDPKLGQVFLDCRSKLEAYYNQYEG